VGVEAGPPVEDSVVQGQEVVVAQALAVVADQVVAQIAAQVVEVGAI